MRGYPLSFYTCHLFIVQFSFIPLYKSEHKKVTKNENKSINILIACIHILKLFSDKLIKHFLNKNIWLKAVEKYIPCKPFSKKSNIVVLIREVGKISTFVQQQKIIYSTETPWLIWFLYLLWRSKQVHSSWKNALILFKFSNPMNLRQICFVCWPNIINKWHNNVSYKVICI